MSDTVSTLNTVPTPNNGFASISANLGVRKTLYPSEMSQKLDRSKSSRQALDPETQNRNLKRHLDTLERDNYQSIPDLDLAIGGVTRQGDNMDNRTSAVGNSESGEMTMVSHVGIIREDSFTVLVKKNTRLRIAINILSQPDFISEIVVRLKNTSMSIQTKSNVELDTNLPVTSDQELTRRFIALGYAIESANISIVQESFSLYQWGCVLEEIFKMGDGIENRRIVVAGESISLKDFWRYFLVDKGTWDESAFERIWCVAMRKGPITYHLVHALGEISLFLPVMYEAFRFRSITGITKTDARGIDFKEAAKTQWRVLLEPVNSQIRPLLNGDFEGLIPKVVGILEGFLSRNM